MSVEPTEDLFDHLMRDLPPFKDTDYNEGDSDEGLEIEDEKCESMDEENEERESHSSSGPISSLDKDINIETKKTFDIVENIEDPSNVLLSGGDDSDCHFNSLDQSDQVSKLSIGTSCSDSMEKIKNDDFNGIINSDKNIVLSKDFSHLESSVEPHTGSIKDLSSEHPESVTVEQRIGLIEPLGIALDPTAAEDYESVETITVDANQKTQDEEYINISESYIDSNSLKTNSGVEVIEKDEIIESKSNIIQCCEESQNCNNESNGDNKSINANSKKSGDLLSGYNYLKSLKIFTNITDEIDGVKSITKNIDLVTAEGIKLNCKVYICAGCDSKFWIERFWNQHVSRVTTKILYDCKQCGKRMTFSNPCTLKIHLKFHGNIINFPDFDESNLKVELPSLKNFKDSYLSDIKCPESKSSVNAASCLKLKGYSNINSLKLCPECNKYVPSLVKHLMFKPESSKHFTCSSCKFIFSSKCALDIHERIHTSRRPYSCPDCGTSFVTRNRLYIHLNLECYHFNRCFFFKCLKCGSFLSDNVSLKKHMFGKHLSTVCKCSVCPSVFESIVGLSRHTNFTHGRKFSVASNNINYRCKLCPPTGQILPYHEQVIHILKHMHDYISSIFGFKCNFCKLFCEDSVLFVNHMEETACKFNLIKKFKEANPDFVPSVLKRKCKEFNNPILKRKIGTHFYDNDKPTRLLKNLTNDECPTKTEAAKSCQNNLSSSTLVTCLLCNKKFASNLIEKHITVYHNCKDHHKYIQVSSLVQSAAVKNVSIKSSEVRKKNTTAYRDNLRKKVEKSSLPKKNRGLLECPNCDYMALSKDDFQSHIVEHRAENAYQCLECGECFVCKNPLEIHLLSVHSIKDTGGYISSHYVHNSLPKPEKKSLQPNQCSVCFDIFPDEKAVKLHFRSHGLAFLRKNFAERMSSKCAQNV